MQLHRPKDINSLNEDFFKNKFSGNTLVEDSVLREDFPSPAPEDRLIQGEIDSIIVENEHDIKSGYVAKQIEKLSNTEFTNSNHIFHDFPEDDYEEYEQTSQFDEKDLFNAFPEIDFDPSVFNDEEELSERELKKESVRKAKEEARATIENEKERIKQQKELEKTVQKPFAKKRTAYAVMSVLIILSILSAAICGIIGNMGKNGNMTKISSLTLHYVDGNNISSQEYEGCIIAVDSGNIQGSQTVLFSNENDVQTIGRVIAIGDNVYGIDTGEKVHRAEKESITGIVKFTTPEIKTVYGIISTFSNILFIVTGICLLTVIVIFAVIIKKLNRKIKELEEEYNII